MKSFYILKEDHRYYVSEGLATTDLSKALRIKSIHELITTIPIMKGWNWDYVLYELSGGKLTEVKEHVWTDIYYEWKKSNPEEHKKLYNTGARHMIRTTTH